MANKWLIVNGGFRMSGSIEFHKELLQPGETGKNTSGGGWWNLDRAGRTLYLYAKSEDFGPALKEETLKAIQDYIFPSYMVGLKVYISTHGWITLAMKDAEGREPDWIIE